MSEINTPRRGHFLNEILINAEDCQSITDFYEFFQIQMSPEFASLLENFKKNPTVEIENKIKFLICQDVGGKVHDVFKDPMFEEIVKECHTTAYEMGFDMHIENALATDEGAK